jgi:hypothetical protein
MIAVEALMVLENNLTFTKQVSRKYSSQFARNGAKIGSTFQIRKPAQYLVQSGQSFSAQNFVETQTTLTLNTQKHIDVSFTSQELTLDINSYSDQVLKPQLSALANAVDADGLALINSVYNSVGTPGTVPNSSATYLNAGALLDKNAAPKSDRAAVISPDMQATIVPALQGLFNPTTLVSKQYETGTMGQALGFKFSMDQNVATHTVGPLGGTPLVNGASQTGASLVTDGWTASAAARLNKGDIFTIAGVYMVNPMSKAVQTSPQQFVVTADVSSDGSGNATIPISPAIVATGAAQNVSNSPANGAPITVVGAAGTVTPQGLAFHPDAFTIASADLTDPSQFGAWGAVAHDDQLGLSIRVWRQADIMNDAFPCRIDILYGWLAVRPEEAVRIQS